MHTKKPSDARTLTHTHRVQLNSNPQQNSSNDRPTKHGVINSKFVFFYNSKVQYRCGAVRFGVGMAVAMQFDLVKKFRISIQ